MYSKYGAIFKAQDESETAECGAASVNQTGIIEYFSVCGSRAAVERGITLHILPYYDFFAIVAIDGQQCRFVDGAGANLQVSSCLRAGAPLADYAAIERCAQSGQSYFGPIHPGSGEAGADYGLVASSAEEYSMIPITGADGVEYVLIVGSPRSGEISGSLYIERVAQAACGALTRLHITQAIMQSAHG